MDGLPVLPLAPVLSSAGCGLSGLGSQDSGVDGTVEGLAGAWSGAPSQPKVTLHCLSGSGTSEDAACAAG